MYTNFAIRSYVLEIKNFSTLDKFNVYIFQKFPVLPVTSPIYLRNTCSLLLLRDSLYEKRHRSEIVTSIS